MSFCYLNFLNNKTKPIINISIPISVPIITRKCCIIKEDIFDGDFTSTHFMIEKICIELGKYLSKLNNFNEI